MKNRNYMPVKAKPMKYYTSQQLKKVEEETASQTMLICTAICLLTLHDEFDMGNKRLEKFIDRFQKKLDCVKDESNSSIEDYVQTIYEETGIQLI